MATSDIANNLPAGLRSGHYFVMWRYENRGQKRTKVPYQVNGGTASVSNPADWLDFDTAINTCESGKFSGIGRVITTDQRLVCIDLDNSVADGNVLPWAKAIVDEVCSYTEFSPSRNGLHIWCRGELADRANRFSIAVDGEAHKIEIYNDKRYITLTGYHIEGTPLEINDGSVAVAAIYGRAVNARNAQGASSDEQSYIAVEQSPALPDNEIVQKASNAANCSKFNLLWIGKWKEAGQPSGSEADLALCSHLAFYTQNYVQIDRLFRRSSLYDEKWEREEYRRRTIGKALEGLSARYGIGFEATGAEVRAACKWPEPLAAAAYYGLAGEIVQVISPQSESDPVALLVQLLVSFGNHIGRSAHFTVEGDDHYGNLYAVLVGDTASGRKGTSLGQIRRLFRLVDDILTDEWDGTCVKSGMSSGEGLIWHVRDPVKTMVPDKKNPLELVAQTSDAGVLDKRLLAVETEFASVLRRLRQDTNTLSAQMRDFFDRGDSRTLTKNYPVSATGAHVSMIGHITRTELLRHLTETETANGFANRIGWFAVMRSKYLSRGGSLTSRDLEPLAQKLAQAVQFARTVDVVTFDDDAASLWDTEYVRLCSARPGLLGAITSRATTQTWRYSMLFALLDGSSDIKPPHLRAALALWDYAEMSVRHTFGDKLGDPVADAILDALRGNPPGLTMTELHNVLGRNHKANVLHSALMLLAEQRLARVERMNSGNPGPVAERWFAI